MNERIFKRLRTRIVIISMSLLLAMMSAVCLTVYWAMAKSFKTNSENVLNYTADLLIKQAETEKSNTASTNSSSSAAAPSDLTNTEQQLDKLLLRNVMIVYHDSTGYIIKVTQGDNVIQHVYTLGRELRDLEQFAEEPIGTITIRDHDYRYKHLTVNNEQMLLLISREGEYASLLPLIGILLTVGIVTMFILLVACIGLARIVVRPIANAWNSQQQFLRDASHELKTPLAVIATNLDAVRSSPDETVASQEKWLTYATDEIEEMRHLMRDMFALAINERPDAEMRKTPFAPFSLSETVTEVGLIFEANALEAGIELVLDVEENLWTVGFRDGIRRVVMILLDNALKNTFAGGKITLELHRNRNDLLITCTNTGYGIPKEELQNIFKRFYRLDSSRARQSGGSGLGLSIAEGAIQKHGGKIWAESEVGSYARFIIKLSATSAPQDK